MQNNLIYESPDGGKTVYQRESGNYDSRQRVSKLKKNNRL